MSFQRLSVSPGSNEAAQEVRVPSSLNHPVGLNVDSIDLCLRELCEMRLRKPGVRGSGLSMLQRVHWRRVQRVTQARQQLVRRAFLGREMSQQVFETPA